MDKIEETKKRFFNLVKFTVIAERHGMKGEKLEGLNERRMELDLYLKSQGLTKMDVFRIELRAIEEGFKTPLCIA